MCGLFTNSPFTRLDAITGQSGNRLLSLKGKLLRKPSRLLAEDTQRDYEGLLKQSLSTTFFPVSWSVCVPRQCNNGWFLFGPNNRTLVSCSTGHKYYPQLHPEPCCPGWGLGLSVPQIKMYICVPLLFVLMDDFCNKNQTFLAVFRFLGMTSCLAYLVVGGYCGSFPWKNSACENYCCFFVCGMKYRI